MQTSLPGLESLEYVLKVAVMTSRIKSTVPVSVLLVAESGAGKSQTVLRVTAPFVHRVDDLTSSGLFDLLEKDRTNELSFIAIPDFNVILSHKPHVTQLLIANLLTVTDTGVVSIADGRQEKTLEHRPVGLLSAVTRDMFMQNYKRWQHLGLVRRFLALHFEYSNETIKKAIASINNGHKAVITATLPPSVPSVTVPLIEIPARLNIEIETRTKDLQLHMGQYISWEKEDNRWSRKVSQGRPVLPMSPYKVMRSMVRAHALLNKRKVANMEDVSFIDTLLSYTNMDKPARV